MIAILLLASGDYYLYPLLPIGGQSFNSGKNAIWLRDSWYRGTEKEKVSSLASRLLQGQFRYAYFHVRFITKHGSLRYRGKEYARRALQINRELKRHTPQVKSLAWIYVGNSRGLTGVNLSDPKVRHAMLREAQWLVRDCGFDGVQWDYEICADGDAALLQLLLETRAGLPKNKIVSVATAMWLPRIFAHWGWSEEYFTRIAAHCDQVVVMGYDSGLYFPRHYEWLMRQQMLRVTRAVSAGNAKCQVLLGVPTYEEGGPSHHPHAENLRMALKATRASILPSNFAGVAIFADYTTDASEWNIWRALWLRKSAQP